MRVISRGSRERSLSSLVISRQTRCFGPWYRDRSLQVVVRIALLVLVWDGGSVGAQSLKLAQFEVDASPPIGSRMAYDPVTEVQVPLSCRGVVLLGAGEPIVLCAVDWIGIANRAHREFRAQLATAVGTSPQRVAIHCLHQHDAPWCDFDTDELITKYQVPYRPFESELARTLFARVADAARQSLPVARPITHVGVGAAAVEQVASNRRVMGPDGKVLHVRYSATKDPKIRAFPEGRIDPLVKIVSFWNGEDAIAALSYYATHPQSYYRTGKANPDFPGMARSLFETANKVPLMHFCGAAGNITAGKYNDGSPANRQVLAERVAAGLQKAWLATTKTPLSAGEVGWQSLPVELPAAPHLDPDHLQQQAQDMTAPPMKRFNAVNALAWLNRLGNNQPIEIACLKLGKTRILHLPGELFIEYQLAAQQLRPDLFVTMAAYGDYGPAYIGTAVSYGQGGYETGPTASFVAPSVEPLLVTTLAKLLDAEDQPRSPLP